MALPYRLILTVVCFTLAIRYVLDRTAPARWKWVIGGLTLATLWLPTSLAWNVVGIVLQLAVCLFVLLREKIKIERST